MNTYAAFQHPHLLFVILFLLLYLVKTGVLLFSSEGAMEKVRKYTRIPEMIISFGFLATGVGLAVQIPASAWNWMLIVKLVLVFGAIPVAVIGFKKRNKALAVLSLLFIVGAYGLAEVHGKRAYAPQGLERESAAYDPGAAEYNQLAHGQALYQLNCTNCHGPNGDMGAAGAANLQVSELSKEETYKLIYNGKLNMPAYGKKLDEASVEALAQYAMSLRKQ